MPKVRQRIIKRYMLAAPRRGRDGVIFTRRPRSEFERLRAQGSITYRPERIPDNSARGWHWKITAYSTPALLQQR